MPAVATINLVDYNFDGSASTSKTLTVTPPDGAFILVTFSGHDDGTPNVVSSDDSRFWFHSSVSSTESSIAGNETIVEFWYSVNPPGVSPLAITLTSGTADNRFGVQVFTGVDDIGGITAVSDSSGAPFDATFTGTRTGGEAWVLACGTPYLATGTTWLDGFASFSPYAAGVGKFGDTTLGVDSTVTLSPNLGAVLSVLVFELRPLFLHEIALTASPSPAAPGQTVTLTAEVLGPDPDTVEFYVDTVLIDTVTAAPFEATFSFTTSFGSQEAYAVATYTLYPTFTTPILHVPVVGDVTLLAPGPGGGEAIVGYPYRLGAEAKYLLAIERIRYYSSMVLIGESTVFPYWVSWTPVETGTASISAEVVTASGSSFSASHELVIIDNPSPSSAPGGWGRQPVA